VSTWRRAPLWLRLVASVLLLAMFALTVSGFAGGRLLRSYLVDQIDEELVAIARAARDGSLNIRAATDLPSPYYFSKLDSSGQEVGHRFAYQGEAAVPDLAGLTMEDAAERNGRPFTTGSTSSDGRWRAIVALTYDDDVETPFVVDPGTFVIATSLDRVDATVARLRTINTLVGLAVLGGLALLGYWTVRSALHPLVEMEQTAGGIAGGDLTRRVPDPDPGTEVGRLGQALNTMLDHVESAFRDRQASEATARSSERRMRQFVADASHELRTPLTSIRGFAELYRQGALTDASAVPDVFRRIEDEATRMGVLVDDLLLLARLDQERPLAVEPVDVGNVVRDAVEAAQAVAPDRKIELVDTLHPTVLGDEPRLRQVVSNLLDNSLRHTPRGSPVEVALARTSRDGRDWAELEVRDHGPGLAPDQASRVFERFYRTDAARTRATGGSGLGLSIVAAIVTAHGGWPEVDRTPGNGATFRVVLPLATDDGAEPKDEAGDGD
jgi:two-component system OmpR family sensor kinase